MLIDAVDKVEIRSAKVGFWALCLNCGHGLYGMTSARAAVLKAQEHAKECN